MRGSRRGGQCCDERGLAFVIVLSVMAFVLVGGVFLLRMSSIEGETASDIVWAEGSFFAAEAAINVALDTMAPHVTTCAGARTSIGDGIAYQVQNTPPNTICFAGVRYEPGYSLGSGTGYNPSGYVFYVFAFTGVGTGPRGARRTIDAQATYGPIAQ